MRPRRTVATHVGVRRRVDVDRERGERFPGGQLEVVLDDPLVLLAIECRQAGLLLLLGLVGVVVAPVLFALGLLTAGLVLFAGLSGFLLLAEFLQTAGRLAAAFPRAASGSRSRIGDDFPDGPPCRRGQQGLRRGLHGRRGPGCQRDVHRRLDQRHVGAGNGRDDFLGRRLSRLGLLDRRVIDQSIDFQRVVTVVGKFCHRSCGGVEPFLARSLTAGIAAGGPVGHRAAFIGRCGFGGRSGRLGTPLPMLPCVDGSGVRGSSCFPVGQHAGHNENTDRDQQTGGHGYGGQGAPASLGRPGGDGVGLVSIASASNSLRRCSTARRKTADGPGVGS